MVEWLTLKLLPISARASPLAFRASGLGEQQASFFGFSRVALEISGHMLLDF